MKNQLITFFSIAPRQGLFRRCFSLFLGCSGCCQPQLRRCFWAGLGLLWEKRERKFREQVHCVFFGRFGRQGTNLRLRKKCFQSKDLRLLLFISFGRRRNCSLKMVPRLYLIGWEPVEGAVPFAPSFLVADLF